MRVPRGCVASRDGLDYLRAMGKPRAGMVINAVLGLVLSGSVGCFGAGEGEPASRDCAALEGIERDHCLHDQLLALPASAPDQVVDLAGQISDPMVRGAAVSGWIAAHVNEVPMDKGKQLCDLLEGRDRGYCQRRLSSPHLK